MNATPPKPNRTVILPPAPDDPALAPRAENADGYPLPPGARLGEFEILRVIGIGGFGIVYLAHDHFLDRNVAVKEYMPTSFALRTAQGNVLATSPREAELFRVGMRSFINEARLLARFDHPALLKVYRFWEANGTAYMAMPFYAGVTLKQALKSGRIAPTEEWIRAFLAYLLDAISLIHAAHCYHRDIAPDNILLLEDGRPMLLDFGAARQVLGDLTHMPTAILKPGYAPIEQYVDNPGMQQGPWTDVYALAAVVYYLINRKAPPPAVARIVQDEMLPAREAGRGRYRDSFLATLDHALAVRPEHRIRSTAQFRDELGIGASMPETMPGAEEATQTRPMTAAPPRRKDSAAAQRRAAGPPWRAFALQGRLIAPLRQWLAVRAPGRRGKRAAIEALLVLVVAAALYGGLRLAARHPGNAVSTQPEQARQGEAAAPFAARSAEPNAPRPSAQAAPGAGSARPAGASDAAGSETRAAPSAAETQRREDELWTAVRGIDKPLVYESFLNRYPAGRHAAEARASLARLKRAEQANAPVAPRSAAPASPAQEAPPAAAPSMAQPPKVAAPTATPAPDPAPAVRTAPPAPSSQAARPAAADAPAAQEQAAPVKPADTAAAAQKPAPAAREPQAARETMSPDGKVLNLPGQTMTGDFTPDPVTGAVSGRGRIAWDNGDRFEGTLVRGVRQGKGEFVWANGQRYKGDWARGLPNGKGTMQFANGNRYEGEMKDGVPNGVGVIEFSNGNRYAGEVRNGLPDGTGTNRFANGDVYSGAWRAGKSNGHGRYTWAGGETWEGEFRDGAKTANGGAASASSAEGKAETR